MEYVGALAPIAFVFAISALTQLAVLRKELAELRRQVEALGVARPQATE